MKHIKELIAGKIIPFFRFKNTMYDLAIFANDHISEAVIAFGSYEKMQLNSTLDNLKFLCPKTDFSNGICLDVGANVGNHSLFYSFIFKHVFSFEPNPIVYKLLEASILKNGIKNITLFKCGLSDSNCDLKLKVNSSNLGMSTLAASINDPNESVFDVKICTGDELLLNAENCDADIVFIKIDVEGHESNAITGLARTITKFRPVIALELNFQSDNKSASDAVSKIYALGYTKFYSYEAKFKSRYKVVNYVIKLLLGNKYSLKPIDSFDRYDYRLVYCLCDNATS